MLLVYLSFLIAQQQEQPVLIVVVGSDARGAKTTEPEVHDSGVLEQLFSVSVCFKRVSM